MVGTYLVTRLKEVERQRREREEGVVVKEYGQNCDP